MSGAILEADGESIISDAQKMVPVPFGDIIVTTAGYMRLQGTHPPSHALGVGSIRLDISDIDQIDTQISIKPYYIKPYATPPKNLIEHYLLRICNTHNN